MEEGYVLFEKLQSENGRLQIGDLIISVFKTLEVIPRAASPLEFSTRKAWDDYNMVLY